MQDKETYNEATDGFSRYMKDRLAEHRLPVDEGCWDAIDTEVGRKPSRSWLLWALVPAIAALMAGLIWLLPISTERVLHEGVVLELEESSQPSLEEFKESFPIEPEYIQPPVAKNKPSTSRLIARSETVNTVIPEVSDIPEIEILIESIPDAVEEPEENVEQKKEETASITPEREERVIPHGHVWKKPQKRTSRKRGWAIGSHVGSTANFSGLLFSGDAVLDKNNSGNITDPGAPGTPEEPENPTLPENNRRLSSIPLLNKQELIDRLKDEDFSDVSYSVPISVGITVRRGLNDYLALESGLVYTYLHTRFEQRNGSYYARTKLGLHYLGIPLYLVGSVWSNDKWDIYLSGGFMAEKGLKAIYSHERQTQQATESVSFRTSIKGMQWSLNLSAGISYRLYDNWSLYAEPRFSYYFDNDQPASVRTDKSYGIGIGAGIRYTF